MIILGLTGDIASGKSTVADFLRAKGAEIIDADLLVRDLYGNPEFASKVAMLFGESVLASDGSVDRKALGAIVFADARAMRQLEALVHPAVGWLRDRLIEELRRLDPAPPVVVIEAVKLVESSQSQQCDAVWIVRCRPETQMRRLMENRGLTAAEARERIASQPSFEKKLEILGGRAHAIIDNDGTREDLERRVKAEWDKLTSAGATKTSHITDTHGINE